MIPLDIVAAYFYGMLIGMASLTIILRKSFWNVSMLELSIKFILVLILVISMNYFLFPELPYWLAKEAGLVSTFVIWVIAKAKIED